MMEINGVVDGTHMVINPANNEPIGCNSLAQAQDVARLLSQGTRTVRAYKFVMAGELGGGWLKVWTCQVRKKAKSASA